MESDLGSAPVKLIETPPPSAITIIGATFCFGNFLSVLSAHPQIVLNGPTSNSKETIYISENVEYFGAHDNDVRKVAKSLKAEHRDGKIITVLCDPLERVLNGIYHYGREHSLDMGSANEILGLNISSHLYEFNF